MKKLLFGLLLGSLITQSGCLRATSETGKSLAVRFDGSKIKGVGYNQRIMYFSDKIPNLTYKNVMSYIKKVDNGDICHEFYVMSRTKKDQGGTYQMDNGSSISPYEDAPVPSELYFEWDGSEDLTKAAKNNEDISLFALKNDKKGVLVTPEMYKNPKNDSSSTTTTPKNDNNSTTTTSENGSSSTTIILIGVGVVVIGGLLYYYFSGETKQTKKEAV